MVPVKFALVKKRSLQPEFIERKMSIPEPRPLPPAVVPEIATTAPAANPEPAHLLFAEPVPDEPAQPQPRRSAFKKEAGTPREWKPVD